MIPLDYKPKEGARPASLLLIVTAVGAKTVPDPDIVQ